MSMSFKADPSGTFGEILVNGQVVAKLPVTGNAVLPGLVGTVSESGGIPTGAVVERGSNANGEYVRFADGTQICTGSTETTIQLNDLGSGNYRYRYDQRSKDFAAIFVSVPKVAVTFANNSAYAVAGVERTIPPTTSNSGRIRGSGSDPDITDSYYTFIAIGRWF